MNKIKTGFKYQGMNIYYLDLLGKDISFERWRINLYYKPNYAYTEFFVSEKDYYYFFDIHKKQCYSDYAEFCKWWESQSIKKRKQ